MPKRMLTPAAMSTLVIAALGITSCNVFSPIAGPSSDPQYLSAARACFDKGDFQCARDNYDKLSGSYSDTATAEEAFLTLDQEGASMSAFMEFVANVSDYKTGKALTIFANRLATGGGATRRVAIWSALHSAGQIQDSQLKNFVQFISSTALAVEILGEIPPDGSALTTQNLASNPTACQSLGTGCAVPGSNACDDPSGSLSDLDTSTAGTSISGSSAPNETKPTLTQLFDAIEVASTALGNLAPGGKFSNTSQSFSDIVKVVNTYGKAQLATPNSPVDHCLRQSLLNLGIGSS